MPESPGAPPLRASRNAVATAHAESCTGSPGSCARTSGEIGDCVAGAAAPGLSAGVLE